MADTYVAAKVREALARANGDPAAAQRVLIEWCGRDGRLMRGLVVPFMKGIVAHAVNREINAAKPAMRQPNLSPQAFDALVGQMGRRIGVNPQPHGMTALVNPPQQPAAGAAHERNVRQLAAAFARKRPQR